MKALLAGSLVLVLLQSVSAEKLFTIPADNSWDSWSYPRGLITVEPDGLQVKRFRKAVDALADADQYRSSTVIGAHGTRVVRTPTNQAAADLVRDQRADTWWTPDPSSPLEDWWLEIDLGRVVLASKVRLVFADTAGVQPFRFFSVYTSPGLPIAASPQDLYFTRAGGTIKANSSRVVEFELSARNPSEATGLYLDTGERLSFDPIRFVRFVAEARLDGAALAEVQVESIGENIALKVTQWGGTIASSARSAGVSKLVNGDLNSQGGWGIEHNAGRQEGWRPAGMWFRLDMLNTFRIDRIVWVPIVQNMTPWFYSLDNERAASWEGTSFKTSDGTPAASIAGVSTEEGNFTYEMLSEVDNRAAAKSWIFDLSFPARPTRLLFWYYDRVLSFTWTRALQMFVFHAEGYPERVALTSAYIDFGEARSISRVDWDALTPPATRVEVQTKSGNTFDTVKHYYAKQGTQEVEVSEESYRKLPKVAQGRIVEERKPGTDWSDWSALNGASGDGFQSPTPRRYLQARVFLSSADPLAMPVLRSLSFAYNPPLVAGGLLGQIDPRRVPMDSLVTLRYTVWPQYRSGDTGFDQLALQVPAAAGDVEAFVGGRPVTVTVQQQADTLLLDLGRRVLGDSVEVTFSTRLAANPTVFAARVLSSNAPGVWQGVVARSTDAEKVYVPEIYGHDSFFYGVTSDRACTPNGDGVNDAFDVEFALVRAQGEPQGYIYRLDGGEVVRLSPQPRGDFRLGFRWEGRDGTGRVVAPGVYLFRARIETDAGDEEFVRPVSVTY